MCESCETKSKYWTIPVVRGWFLIQATVDGEVMKAGEFALSNVNSVPPIIWTDMSDNGLEIFRENIFLHPTNGYSLVKSCIESGWEEKSSIEMFLWERIKKLVENESPV